MRHTHTGDGAYATLVPKLCGADVEMGNFILGQPGPGDTAREAARLLLASFRGVPADGARPLVSRWDRHAAGGGVLVTPLMQAAEGHDADAWGRKFLRQTGGCVYIDLDHIEVCIPEVRSAHDHVAAWHATLRLLRDAQVSAAERLPEGQTLQVLANNTDHRGHSYGAHLSFLLARPAWEGLFERRLHHMLFLATFHVSSVVITGQGKVGSENGAPAVPFQLQARADFLETLTGPQTTWRRPIVNSRDESLTGHGETSRNDLARLHCIFYDSTLAHVASLLKVGTLQIILAMIEAGRVDPDLILDDPIPALRAFSHDPTLEARAQTVSGDTLSALELQWLFYERAAQFVESGACDAVVPRAAEIMKLWEDTLRRLEDGDIEALARRLDWVLKLSILDRARQKLALDWDAPQLVHLDQLYSSLDPEEGLYWAHERAGLVDRVVSEEEIETLTMSPPPDTRAWTRAMLLRRAPETRVVEIDWDVLRFRARRGGGLAGNRTVSLHDPLGHTRRDNEARLAACAGLDDALDALGATTEPAILPDAAASYEWSTPGWVLRVKPS